MLSFECCQGAENTASMDTHSRASATREFFPLITIPFPLLQPVSGLSQVVTVDVWAASDPIFSVYFPIRLLKIVIMFPLKLFCRPNHPHYLILSLYLITLAHSCVDGPVTNFLHLMGIFGIWEQLKQDAVPPEWYHRCRKEGKGSNFHLHIPAGPGSGWLARSGPPQSSVLCSGFTAVSKGCLELLAVSGLFPILCGISV